MPRQKWQIRSTLAEVAAAAAAAEAFCTKVGADKSQSLRIGLALDELASNALMHGAVKEGAPIITAEVWDDEDTLHLCIDAEGPRFDPRNQPDNSGDDFSIGGRGLTLVFAFADSLSYKRDGQRNITNFSVLKHGSDDE
ncbi:MAG: ATP-binding protein [Pikeienuella sp.]